MQKSILVSAVLPIALFVAALVVYASASVVQPGNKGVQITFGKVNPETLSEGLHFINPVSIVKQISIRQATAELREASALSSDLQNVRFNVKVLYRIPDTSVVEIFTRFAGDPFTSLISPRVQEALKEAAASLSAEEIATSREAVKKTVLESARQKLALREDAPSLAASGFRVPGVAAPGRVAGVAVAAAVPAVEAPEAEAADLEAPSLAAVTTPDAEAQSPARPRTASLLEIVDLVIEGIQLSPELERAIEAKMVQAQEAARATFVQNQAKVEAETAAIRAQGEANALKIRGDALKQNPQVLQMNLIEKWNGVSPLVVGGGTQGSSFILPLEKK